MKRFLSRDKLSAVGVLLLLGCIDPSRSLQPKSGDADAAQEVAARINTYTIHDLGTLPGTTLGCCSEGRDINAAGDVAGNSTASDGRFHAVLWQGSSPLDLGIPVGYSDTFAEGLNDAGTVVGFANTGTIQPVAGFIWTAATGMTLLTGPGPAPRATTANDINNAGVVVGQIAASNNVHSHAYKFTTAGGYVDLHPVGYHSSNALAIAENGDIAGVVTLPGFAALHAALWMANGTFVDLGTLGGTTARAFGVNSLGSVVGVSANSGGVDFGFLWRSGTGMQPSPMPGGANDISDGDRIVGFAVSGAQAIPGTKLGSGPVVALPQFTGRRGGVAVAVNRCGAATGSAKLSVQGVISTHGALWVPSSCDP